MALVASPALAQTLNVDSYTITLPDDLQAAETNEEDKADGLLLDMEGETLEAVAYVYEPDPSYARTLDEVYDNYLAEQQEGYYTSVAIDEFNGVRMIVYATEEGTVGAYTMKDDGRAFEFIMIAKQDSALDAAKSAIESIRAS
jgi:hypothetical protein